MAWKIEQLDFIGCDRVKPSEERDVSIVLEEEKRALINGVVKFPDGKEVNGAVVKLFHCKERRECAEDYDLIPITFTFTDEHGRFLFAVEPDKDYTILVFYNKSETSVKPQKIDIKNLDLL